MILFYVLANALLAFLMQYLHMCSPYLLSLNAGPFTETTVHFKQILERPYHIIHSML